jgi:uncharacterized protein
MIRYSLAASVLFSTMLGSSSLLSAMASGETALSEDKPFAETHVILQVSQSDPSRYGLTLDVANNLGKHYGGADMVDIEIVAFGSGVPMLFADSLQKTRITSLMAQGVRFYVCGNTLDSIERRDGKRPAILDGVEVVQTGVAFMVDEIKRGYIHVQP